MFYKNEDETPYSHCFVHDIVIHSDSYDRLLDRSIDRHSSNQVALMTKSSTDVNLLILWLLATAFGPFVGLTFLFGYLAHDSYKWTTILPLSLVITGILLGVGQWAVLRTQLKNVWTWIPLTAFGFLLGVYLGLVLADRFEAGYWNPSMPISIGTILGITQWPVIAKKVNRSIFWIPASIISWTIGMGIPLAVFDHTTSEKIWADYLLVYGAGLGLMWGILVGSISGILLTFLVGRSVIKTGSG